MRAEAYKHAPFDLVNGVQKVERVYGLPLELEIVPSFPRKGLAEGQALVRAGNSGCSGLSDKSIALVITDPPYMYNVHYSQLADSSHSWLRPVRPYTDYRSEATATRDV